ncbi:metal-dependent amidase/aminoacylase/carboxypeptidase family protein [Streptomyces rapamycinicus]|uniref:Amidohydrolase n=2 Tax=Streptomyces rapamycinicus TaxID=1226757 RepID=A0A3L8R8L8_STRRN|nr:metal-dependent amidase/aminoacylase/carboxypeptidase family protein [Streptomyces rapamycinicus]RLV76119.1 amidohydrolase [Streptomyces rapamycinicus NRRL 5491]
MTVAIDTVLRGLDGIRTQVQDLYRDLHAHPELGLAETRTSARVAERLRARATRSSTASAAPVSSAS